MPNPDLPVTGPQPTLQASSFDAMAANLRDRKRLLKQLELELAQVRKEVDILSSDLNAFVGRATCV